jgi:hypothetical protein
MSRTIVSGRCGANSFITSNRESCVSRSTTTAAAISWLRIVSSAPGKSGGDVAERMAEWRSSPRPPELPRVISFALPSAATPLPLMKVAGSRSAAVTSACLVNA